MESCDLVGVDFPAMRTPIHELLTHHQYISRADTCYCGQGAVLLPPRWYPSTLLYCHSRRSPLFYQAMESVDLRTPALYREPTNAYACGGPGNVDDGCQSVFPRAPPGTKLCFLCTKLKDSTISSADKEEIQVRLSLPACFAS